MSVQWTRIIGHRQWNKDTGERHPDTLNRGKLNRGIYKHTIWTRFYKGEMGSTRHKTVNRKITRVLTDKQRQHQKLSKVKRTCDTSLTGMRNPDLRGQKSARVSVLLGRKFQRKMGSQGKVLVCLAGQETCVSMSLLSRSLKKQGLLWQAEHRPRAKLFAFLFSIRRMLHQNLLAFRQLYYGTSYPPQKWPHGFLFFKIFKMKSCNVFTFQVFLIKHVFEMRPFAFLFIFSLILRNCSFCISTPTLQQANVILASFFLKYDL